MRSVVFVVGMGRSGTSAFTRVLALCGAALPLRLLPPNWANPSGFWEPQGAFDINNEFLAWYGSSWDDDTLLVQNALVTATERARFVAQIGAFFRYDYPARGPLIVKEPRITALLPYWTAAAQAVGLQPKIAHVFRHPDDVVASLRARDDLSPATGRSLWLKANLLAERDGRAFPRAFVAYEELMANWEGVVERCARELGLAGELGIDDRAREAVGEFLQPELRHHATDALVEDETPEALITRTYARLCAACHGLVDTDGFDAAFAAFAKPVLAV